MVHKTEASPLVKKFLVVITDQTRLKVLKQLRLLFSVSLLRVRDEHLCILAPPFCPVGVSRLSILAYKTFDHSRG